jgi:DNA-binding PadR family transcriptional regulator
MEQIEQVSEGTSTVGSGTLYRAFSTLEKEGRFGWDR